MNLKKEVANLEKRLILRALRRSASQQMAADMLSISKRALIHKMSTHNINYRAIRAGDRADAIRRGKEAENDN